MSHSSHKSDPKDLCPEESLKNDVSDKNSFDRAIKMCVWGGVCTEIKGNKLAATIIIIKKILKDCNLKILMIKHTQNTQ